MPYVAGGLARIAYMGDDDDSGALAPAIAAWQARVRARGGVPTRMPYQRDPLNAGKLAARFVDRKAPTGWRYELADAAALDADGRGAAVLAQRIDAGKHAVATTARETAATVRQGVQDVAGVALDVPRQLVGGILGIPPWAVTAIVVVGGLFAAKSLLPQMGRR